MRYFSIDEFDSPDRPGSASYNMDLEFLEMLDEAREIAGVPFIVNSAYRTKEHNSNVGGSATSSHLLGHAADISTSSVSMTTRMIRALALAGFNRIGVSDTFIHVDNDPDKPEAYWSY